MSEVLFELAQPVQLLFIDILEAYAEAGVPGLQQQLRIFYLGDSFHGIHKGIDLHIPDLACRLR